MSAGATAVETFTKAEAKAMVDEALNGLKGELKELLKPATDNGAKPAAAAKNWTPQSARSQRLKDAEKAFLERDKHKGAGLNLARAAKALAVARADGEDYRSVLKGWGHDDVAMKMEEAAEIAKAMGESTLVGGGAWVPDEFSSEFINVLTPQAVILQTGIFRIPSARDTLTIPKLTSTTTAAYIGESQAPTASQPNTGQLQMKNKKLAAATPLSMDLVRDAAVASDAIIRDRLVRDFALKMDLTLIRGAIVPYAPSGLRFLMNTANVGTSTGTSLSQIIHDLYALMGFVQDANIPMDGCVWIMSWRVWRGLMQQRDGVGNFIFRPELMDGKLFGYRVFVTNQIPNNLGGGSNSEIYFGQPSEYFVSENLAMEVKASTEAAYVDGSGNLQSTFSRDEMIIQVFGRHDSGLAHDLAFACLPDSQIGT